MIDSAWISCVTRTSSVVESIRVMPIHPTGRLLEQWAHDNNFAVVEKVIHLVPMKEYAVHCHMSISKYADALRDSNGPRSV